MLARRFRGIACCPPINAASRSGEDRRQKRSPVEAEQKVMGVSAISMRRCARERSHIALPCRSVLLCFVEQFPDQFADLLVQASQQFGGNVFELQLQLPFFFEQLERTAAL